MSLEILQLVNERVELAAPFITEGIMEAFAEGFWAFLEHQPLDQYRVSLKVSIAAKALQFQLPTTHPDERFYAMELFGNLPHRVKNWDFCFLSSFLGLCLEFWVHRGTLSSGVRKCSEFFIRVVNKNQCRGYEKLRSSEHYSINYEIIPLKKEIQ